MICSRDILLPKFLTKAERLGFSFGVDVVSDGHPLVLLQVWAAFLATSANCFNDSRPFLKSWQGSNLKKLVLIPASLRMLRPGINEF